MEGAKRGSRLSYGLTGCSRSSLRHVPTPLGWPLPGRQARITNLPCQPRAASTVPHPVDPNEEKVKHLPSRSSPRNPSSNAAYQPSAPRGAAAVADASLPAAAAALAGALAAGPATASPLDADVPYSGPLSLSFGEPCEFLPHTLLGQQQAAATAQAAAALATAMEAATPTMQGGVGPAVKEAVGELQEGGQQLLGLLGQQVEAVQLQVETSVEAAQQVLAGNMEVAVSMASRTGHQASAVAADAYSGSAAAIQQLADSLESSMASWPVAPQALQLACYFAAASAVLVLLRGSLTAAPAQPATSPAATSNSPVSSSQAARGPSAGTRPRAEKQPVVMRQLPLNSAAARRMDTWGLPPSERQQQQQQQGARGSVPAREISPSPRREAYAYASSSVAADGVDGLGVGPRTLNPVQAAWQHFRGTLHSVVARATTPTPPATAAAVSGEAGGAVQGRGGAGKGEVSVWGVGEELPEVRSLRSSLKEQLQLVCDTLGPFLSVVPAGDPVRPHADSLLLQLEAVAPAAASSRAVGSSSNPQGTPASTSFNQQLLGDWQLVYATNQDTLSNKELHSAATAATALPSNRPSSSAPAPTSRTTLSSSPAAYDLQAAASMAGALRAGFTGGGMVAAMLHLVAALPAGWGLQHVDQQLDTWSDADGAGAMRLRVTNSATLCLGPLGVWRVEARGCWEQAPRDPTSGMPRTSSTWHAWFDSLALQPVSMLGQDLTRTLPEVVVQLPPQLRGASDWVTTYVDDTSRITRGSGAVFLFKRMPYATAEAMYDPMSPAHGGTPAPSYATGAYA